MTYFPSLSIFHMRSLQRGWMVRSLVTTTRRMGTLLLGAGSEGQGGRLAGAGLGTDLLIINLLRDILVNTLLRLL